MSTLISKAIEEIETASNQVDGLSGVPSGFTALDRITGGWQKSDLLILAARPGMGKTAFVVSMAKNAAVQFKKPVAIFSLEMSSLQLVKRLISSETEISQDKILKGNLENHEFVQLNERIKSLAVAPLYIDDTPALSIFELRAKARRLKENQKVEMIIIDYLQLMSGGPDGKGNREQEISTISRGLKSLAKELEIPIIALSQLSRQVENRPGGSKRPQLSDLRESGAIEQDADMVMFIYRPEYYGLEVDEENQPTKGRGELIIAKNRHGALETVKLRFLGQFAKFADLDYIEGGDAIYSHNTNTGLQQNDSFLNNEGRSVKTVESKNWNKVDDSSSDIIKRNDIEDF
jgi:replicative DNA helicase